MMVGRVVYTPRPASLRNPFQVFLNGYYRRNETKQEIRIILCVPLHYTLPRAAPAKCGINIPAFIGAATTMTEFQARSKEIILLINK